MTLLLSRLRRSSESDTEPRACCCCCCSSTSRWRAEPWTVRSRDWVDDSSLSTTHHCILSPTPSPRLTFNIIHTQEPVSMRWFFHPRRTGRRHNRTTPPGNEIGPSCAVARCLQRAHTIRTHPGVSAAISAFFVPGNLDLWPLTLKFKLGRDFCTMHITAPTFNRS